MTDDKLTCLVTGGASGIGAATVRLFTERGYRVTIGDIQIDKGEGLADELGNAVSFSPLDVRNETDFERCIDDIVRAQGGLDCMVNNAAIAGVLGPVAEIPVQEFDISTEIILRSVFLGTKHAARVMQPRKRGAIVNTASIAGITGGWGPHVYNACKAGVVNFTRSVALELAEDGIRVNAVCPGVTETPILTGRRDDSWVGVVDKIRDAVSEWNPLNRIAQPSEIAEAIHWLASPAASFITGHILAVDGGLMAGRKWREQPQFQREYHGPRI